MNKETQQSLLSNFFSAYFHEDWPCDAESPEAVITEYVETATTSELRTLSQAIREYARGYNSDRELEEKLFSELGCYYRPSEQGISAKTWLETIANQLSPSN